MVWASFDKFSGSNTHCNVIGENDKGVLILRYKDKSLKRNVYIDFYDHGLRLKNTFAISERKKQVDKVLLLKNQLYVIYHYPNYANRKLFYKALDYETKENKEELKEWVNIPIENNRLYGYDIIYNHTRNAGLINYIQAEDENSTLFIQYFDDALKLEKPVQYTLNFSAKNTKVMSRIMDKNGNYYCIYAAQKGGFFAKDNSIYYLLMYNKKNNEWTNTELNSQELFISSVYLKEDIQNKRVLLSYFYSPNYKNGNYGLTNSAYNSNDQKRIYEGRQKINSEFSRQIAGGKLGKEKELNSFYIKDIVPTSDSGSMIIAERFFLTDQNETFYQNGIPVTQSRNVYNFEEVLVFSNNKYGRIQWNKVLLKRQSSINDGGYFSSIIVVPAPDRVHFIYNEKLVYNGDVIQYSINQDGQTSQKNLFRTDMASYMVIPSESRIIGYNRAAIPMFLSNGERGLLKIIY
jgi:hypothetical protein